MNSKGAIGLSINTLVVIIISLVVLGGGITLLFQFITGAEEIKGNLDAKTDSELERLLIDQGKQVALPLHSASLYGGDSHVFGLGILNIDGTTGTSFMIEVEAKSHPNTITADEIFSWLLFDAGPHKIAEAQHHKEPILVTVPEEAPKGQYVFKATVKKGASVYPNPQTFTVTVN